jgi:HAD superfamily hydrolase (TIGR01549 family)
MHSIRLLAMKAIIFDLDGTLIDSVYAHTLAWQSVLTQFGLSAPAWAIHRRIGMSGTLLVKSIAREQQRRVSEKDLDRLSKQHAAVFRRSTPCCAPLPGARELLNFLAKAKIPHGIATSGKRSEIAKSLKALHLSPEAVVIDGDMVESPKPEPDLFLLCLEKLHTERAECLIVGDAVWDIHAARRSTILSAGLLSGGFGEQELYNAGAMRVYKDAQALHQSIDELGFEFSRR